MNKKGFLCCRDCNHFNLPSPGRWGYCKARREARGLLEPACGRFEQSDKARIDEIAYLKKRLRELEAVG